MLRLFLRLYVILALGLAGAIWLVNYTFDELLAIIGSQRSASHARRFSFAVAGLLRT